MTPKMIRLEAARMMKISKKFQVLELKEIIMMIVLMKNWPSKFTEKGKVMRDQKIRGLKPYSKVKEKMKKNLRVLPEFELKELRDLNKGFNQNYE